MELSSMSCDRKGMKSRCQQRVSVLMVLNGKKIFICFLINIANLNIKQNENSYFVGIKWILLAITKSLNITGILVKVYKPLLGRTS